MANFRNLPATQAAVFEEIATGNDRGHNYSTIKALLRKELIQCLRVPTLMPSGIRVDISCYQVPLDIHIEWCVWCAEQWSEGK